MQDSNFSDNASNLKVFQDEEVRRLELCILKNKSGKRDVSVRLYYCPAYNYFVESKQICDIGKNDEDIADVKKEIRDEICEENNNETCAMKV